MPFIYFPFPVTLSFTNKKLSFLFRYKKAANRSKDRYTKCLLLSFSRTNRRQHFSRLTNHQKKQSPFVHRLKAEIFLLRFFIGLNAKNVHLVLESFQEETIINHQQNVQDWLFVCTPFVRDTKRGKRCKEVFTDNGFYC